jgi:hypothetical protein
MSANRVAQGLAGLEARLRAADGILIAWPVRGVAPLRVARRVTTKVPNPLIVTR